MMVNSYNVLLWAVLRTPPRKLPVTSRDDRWCDREGGTERRQSVPWMVLQIGELGQAIELLCVRRTLVDSGIEIDHMHAWSASRREVELHVALTIEATDVAHVRVVIV